MIKKLLLLALLTLSSGTYAAPELNEEPFNYLGANLAGDDIVLEDYLGKVVVVSFWASWCAPCLQELPVLDAFQKQAGSELMQVVAVNYKEDKKRYRKLHKALSESSTNLIFTHDAKGRIGDKYGVEGLPTLFIIGKSGKVAYKNVGFGDSTIDNLINALNDALAQ
jgi:thiol-disulfide isomerase/thioredoxin